MKKLICNGCSFMAGDAVLWENYCKENNREVTDYRQSDLTDYLEYRMNHNLPMMLAKILGTNRIDVSSDGNSNDMIALNTINYILSLPKDERSNYHAVVGWTSTYRRMKFFTEASCFVNLNIHHLDEIVTAHGGNNHLAMISSFKNYIKTELVESADEDHYINYIKNVMLLENFLIANNITYTFYRAIGSANDCIVRPHTLQPEWTGPLLDKEISDSTCWLQFMHDEKYPHLGSAWSSAILDNNSSNFISNDNRHPNLRAVENFANILSDKILRQNLSMIN